MSKPLADHGTTARAIGRPTQGIKGCRCGPCKEAKSRYNKRQSLLMATGRALTVDAAPVAAHIDALFAAGAGWTQLAAVTACSQATLSNIRRRRMPRIRRSTAVKILAVQPGDARPPSRGIDPTGTRRRAQALMAIGHGPLAIGIASNLDPATIHDVVSGTYPHVTPRVANSIAKAYRKLALTAGTNTRARNRAAANSWPGPLAWGDDIDDPAAVPDTGDQVKKLSDAAVRAADILHLGSFNLPEHEIAARVDVTPQYVRAQLRWTYLADEARRLFKLRYTHDEAAARLDVTPELLEKALRRRPAEDEAQDAQLEAA